jgi:hypothetical protein
MRSPSFSAFPASSNQLLTERLRDGIFPHQGGDDFNEAQRYIIEQFLSRNRHPQRVTIPFHFSFPFLPFPSCPYG